MSYVAQIGDFMSGDILTWIHLENIYLDSKKNMHNITPSLYIHIFEWLDFKATGLILRNINTFNIILTLFSEFWAEKFHPPVLKVSFLGKMCPYKNLENTWNFILTFLWPPWTGSLEVSASI